MDLSIFYALINPVFHRNQTGLGVSEESQISPVLHRMGVVLVYAPFLI